jgi:hypothetical protein
MTTDCGGRDLVGSGRDGNPMTSSYNSMNRRMTPNARTILEEDFSQIKYHDDIFSTVSENPTKEFHARGQSNL